MPSINARTAAEIVDDIFRYLGAIVCGLLTIWLFLWVTQTVAGLLWGP